MHLIIIDSYKRNTCRTNFQSMKWKATEPLCTSKLSLVIVVVKEILFTTYFHEENLSSTFVYLEKLDLCKFLCTCLTRRESTR